MWIKKRLKEAKGAGLIRVAKASGAAPSLATATVAPSRSRPSDAPRSPAPVPTSFEATPPASPAPAPASPAPAASAASPSTSRQPREHALPPTPEPAAARHFAEASAARTPQSSKKDVASNTRVSFTPPASPEFSPSVFVPASAAKVHARASFESARAEAIDTSMGEVAEGLGDVPGDVPSDVAAASGRGEKLAEETAKAASPISLSEGSAARRVQKQKRPEYDDIDVDDDVEPVTAWFTRRETEEPEAFPRDDGARGVTWNVPPGALPPAAVSAVADAARAKDATMAGTVGETGSRARRMAEAAALARRDLAAREASGYAAANRTEGGVEPKGDLRKGKVDGGGRLSVAARGHARLLQLRAEREAEHPAARETRGVAARKPSGVREKELETLRRREKALAAKNRQLADALDASTRAASRREAAVRESKALAANADAQLRAALERARLGVPPRLRTAARGGARAFRETGRTRGGPPGTTAPGARFDARVFEPATLREAATRFISVAGASPSKAPPKTSSKRDRAPSPQSESKHAKPRGAPRGGAGAPEDFLERMRLREEQTRARRQARAPEWQSRAAGATAKPGWDDSPDVVVRVGASPAENRRREREREAERALLAARREALLEQMHAQRASPAAPAVGVDAIMRGMGFAKARRPRPGATSSPSPRAVGGRSPRSGGGSRRKSLSPAAERQREADARRAAGLDPKFTRVAFGKPSRKKSPEADRGASGRSPSTSARKASPRGDVQELRRTATRMLDTPEGRASLRASGFDLDGALRRSAAAQTGASLAATSPGEPAGEPALFATHSPARRVVEAANGDPRKQIDAMRAILDDVVAHLRVLHEAAEGRADANAAKTSPRGDARAFSNSSVAVDAAVDSAPEDAKGAYALDAIDRNKALDMLRAVEAREIAIRRKWGLRGADSSNLGNGATLASSSTYSTYSTYSTTAPMSPHADVVARARSSIREIEADTAHVSRRISADVRSLRDAGAAALEATTDADSVARVWEARSRYVRWRAAADDAVSVLDGEGDAFDPSEVNEEVAERLLDGLLTDVAIELTGACDDATAAVLRQEFTSSAEREAEDASASAGGYDAGSNLIDDDVVGAAVERAYLRGGGWKPDE